ncbi:MAG: hypothetical protein NWF07_07270 [Candidatus Bathyarchaeota archaeon]|nr:hypothetical protein [Candidatus Bathyarchaeota archaeon]
MAKLTTKNITFIAIMAALGNILSMITTQVGAFAPNIPLGPIQVSLALDISHLTTFIAALFGGPVIGGITGAVGGLVAAFEFGFSKGNIVTGIGLPLGKALTGITAGYLFKKYDADSFIKTSTLTAVAYIPEALLTFVLFRYLLPVVSGLPVGIATLVAIQIIVKAFFEMILLGFLLISLTRNTGFTENIQRYFR